MSSEWLKAADVIGSAYILDRVIGNRVGDDPEKRAVAEAIADSIQVHHATLFADALATEFRRR
ncbi:MAG: hypothetical protein ACREBE_24875 [bacterium]